MGLGSFKNLNPTFKVIANKRDITDAINERFIQLRVTDEAGLQSDEIELIFDDVPKLDSKGKALPYVDIPATGAALEVFVGYDGQNVRMGTYYVDEVELSGPPDKIQVRAKAAPYAQKGGARLQTQKTRSWAAGTTLGDMVRKIAADNGLKPVVAPDLAKQVLASHAQTDESDIHLLTRIAWQYGAMVKPAEGKLIVIRTGTGRTASGKAIPTITIDRSEVLSWRVTIAKRDKAGSVTAKYHDASTGQTLKVTVGSGEPKQSIKHVRSDRNAAYAAAQARLNRKHRGGQTISLTISGRPEVQAEGKMQLTGFRPGLGGSLWTITRVEHTIDSGGFSTSIDAELSLQP